MRAESHAHANAHAGQFLNEMLDAKTPAALLGLFERERTDPELRSGDYGWYTAAVTTKRLSITAKKVKWRPGGAPQMDTMDPKFSGLLHVMDQAMDQGVMDSKARMGHACDDLKGLVQDLRALRKLDGSAKKLRESGKSADGSDSAADALVQKIARKLEEEADEEDEAGEFGFDTGFTSG